MGGANSVPLREVEAKMISTKDITPPEKGVLQHGCLNLVRLMMPVYYTCDAITKEECDAALEAWQMISNNEAPNYLKQQLESIEFATAYPTAMSYFSDLFYSRLFDVHPFSQNLFKDVRSQGKFLTKMISLSLTEFYDPTKYELTLRKLAEVHNERGVKAAEYGIVGEVLFWALKRVLGTEVFDAFLHIAWVKIYSRMLRTMVPVAVAHELQQGSVTQKRREFNKGGVSMRNPERVAN
jgi:hemoglobin-like flavoprotein